MAKQRANNRVFLHTINNKRMYFVINQIKKDKGDYEVVLGPQPDNLSSFIYDAESDADVEIEKLIKVKLSEGYVEQHDLFYDKDKNLIVSRNDAEHPTSENNLNYCLWYRISKQVDLDQLRNFLISTYNKLTPNFLNERECLLALPVYQELWEGNVTGSANFEEGPLAVLLLFALRRHFNTESSEPSNGNIVQVADDDNQLLPHRFEDLNRHITQSCEYLFNSKGWLDLGANFSNEDGLLEKVGDEYGLGHYSSVSAIKQLAIAMGCIDAPIVLSEIQSETSAAFF